MKLLTFLGLSFLLLACAPVDSEPASAASDEAKFTTPRRGLAGGVAPLLSTEWGQTGVWQQHTPTLAGAPTYPGCTTVASAQVLYYYQYQNYYLHHD